MDSDQLVLVFLELFQFWHQEPHILGKLGQLAALPGCLLAWSLPSLTRSFMDSELRMLLGVEQRRGEEKNQVVLSTSHPHKGPPFSFPGYTYSSSCITRTSQYKRQ